jgi:hypothetical protein
VQVDHNSSLLVAEQIGYLAATQDVDLREHADVTMIMCAAFKSRTSRHILPHCFATLAVSFFSNA